MDSEAENVYKTITYSKKEDENDFNATLAKYEAHFIPKMHIIHVKAKFNLRVQHTRESVTTFARALFELTEHWTSTMKMKK